MMSRNTYPEPQPDSVSYITLKSEILKITFFCPLRPLYFPENRTSIICSREYTASILGQYKGYTVKYTPSAEAKEVYLTKLSAITDTISV